MAARGVTLPSEERTQVGGMTRAEIRCIALLSLFLY